MFAGHVRICRQIQQLPKLATAGVRGNPLTYETGYGPLLGLADFFHVGNPSLSLVELGGSLMVPWLHMKLRLSNRRPG